ncbi:MAG TPA: TonB-dependent receptor [Phenylobacterium sp.]|nr:TonB-dependent receptor [Phenylobacterium sp.]
MQHKVRLLASSALLIAAALGTSANAQTKPAAQAAVSNTIEELVVTAEKRTESLQDVPVAISAFTSTNRDLIGINTIQDMTDFTPGLNYTSSDDRTSIRGVSRLTNQHPVSVPVAVYDDGIYTTSTVTAGKTPIFTDRVEVLRGPQGTLYGRNSLGGAINVISKRPTEDPYAEVRATVDNYGRTLLEAAISGPLAPDLQYRLAGNWEKQRDGYFTNVVPNMPSEGNVIDQYYLEAQIQAKFGDHADGWFKASIAGWNNGAGGPGARAGYSPGPYNFNEFSGQNINPEFACAPGGGATNVVNLSPTGCNNPATNDPRKFASDIIQTVSLDDTYTLTANYTYHFDGFDVKYIGGGQNYHYTLFQDNGSGGTAIQSFTLPLTPVPLGPATGSICNTTFAAVGACGPINFDPPQSSTYQENYHNVSHEIDFASTGNSPFQWLGGLYYYKEGYTQPVFTTMADQSKLHDGSAVTPALPSVTGPVGLPFQNRLYDDRTQFEQESYAVFGQIDWKFTDTLKLTLGLRWNHDGLTGTEAVRALCYTTVTCLGGTAPELLGTFAPVVDITPDLVYLGPGVPKGVVAGSHAATGGVFFTPDGFAHRNYDLSSEATTGTAGLTWTPDKDTTAYITYGRGYLAGGIAAGVTSTEGQFPATDPEFINDYEIGLKKDWTSRLQTNVAIFYYDFTGFQAPLSVANLTNSLLPSQSRFVNIPKSISEGIEFESTWAPIDNLRILFDYDFNPTKVTQLSGVIDPADPEGLQPGAKPIGPLLSCTGTTTGASPNALCDVNTGLVQRFQNLSGNELPQQPRNKIAFNVLYTWDLEKGSISPSATYIWRDKEYSGIFQRDYYASKAWDQVDARITWKDKDNRYSIIAYVKNAFNTLGYDGGSGAGRVSGAYTNTSIAAAAGQPVHVVPGLAQNSTLTNGVLVGPGIGPGSIESNYALTPPRTYGVEFQYRF